MQARLDAGMYVSGSYFSVLGLKPALGRLLRPQDDDVDGQANAVVLSHAYWQSQFAGDTDVVGRSLIVNGKPLTIVGVAPSGFDGTTIGARARVFVPITFRPVDAPTAIPNHDNREMRWLPLFARLEQSVGARCLSREVAVNDGRVACTVMEVTLRPDGCGSCDPTLGRRPLAGAGLRSALEEEMQPLGLCGPGPGVPCEHFCACELQQLEGSDLVTCQNASTLPSEPHGYCYVDEENGAPALLSTCPAGSKRILRFTGDDTPAEGALVFVACR